jgi:hypothetical protein
MQQNCNYYNYPYANDNKNVLRKVGRTVLPLKQRIIVKMSPETNTLAYLLKGHRRKKKKFNDN